MEAFPPEGAQHLNDATLLVPVVSVGNCSQLAADLIISTCQVPRTARLQHDALLPAVGHRGYAHVEGLATGMELYQQQGGQQPGVAVVQQRAAAAPGTQDTFAQDFAAFIKQSGIKEVVVLGSIEATQRRDAQLVGPQLRCWAPAGSSELQQRCCAATGLPPLEPTFFEDRSLEHRLLQPWPLLRHLKAAGVPCCAILSFSTEGDNLGEAFVMATAAAAAVGLGQPSGSKEVEARQWVPPQSWQYVYGAGPAVY